MRKMPFIDDRWTFLSYKAIVLENRLLRIVVLPELGGRIWSVIYKPLDREIVWQNPRIDPQKAPFGSAFDNVWCGGWEEMFPTAAPATINGEVYPDHGEIWSLAWTLRIEQGKDSATLRLNCQTPISGIAVEKALVLREDTPSFKLSYTVENRGPEEFPFLFALHPAMAVSEGDRVDFPDMLFETDPSYPGTLAGVESPFKWPVARGKGTEMDLRTVKPASSKAVYFLYGHGYKEGWFAVTDPVNKFSAGVTFSPEFFRSCWVFASYGGWRGYHMALVEPCTSFPQQLEDSIRQGLALKLAPGATLQTTLTFLAQEGLSSVGGISKTGLFQE
jgi:galactose mutarotase-like enzyme